MMTDNSTGRVPAVSVIVPLFNKELWVRECLESLAAQTLLSGDPTALEIIVVDDGSTDRSAELVEAFIAARPFVGNSPTPAVRLIRQPNGGPSSARNVGLREATGDWIAFVDADDTIAPSMYAHLLAIADRHGCDVARAAYVRGDEGSLATPDASAAAPVEVVGGAELYRRLFAGPDISLMTACTSLYRRSLLIGHGITFDEGLLHTEDALFNAEVYSLDTQVAVSAAAVYRYRVADGSLGQAYDPELYLSADRLRERLTLFELKAGKRGDAARAGSVALRRYLGLYYTIALADTVADSGLTGTALHERLATVVSSSEMTTTMEDLERLGELGPYRTVWSLAKRGRWGLLVGALRAFNLARNIRRS